MKGSRAELEQRLADCVSIVEGNFPDGLTSRFLQELLRAKSVEIADRIRRELASRDEKKGKPKRKSVPFVAIGNNELGGPIGATTACPGCNEAHAVEESVPAGLSFVLCLKTKHRYLVGVDGKKWGRT